MYSPPDTSKLQRIHKVAQAAIAFGHTLTDAHKVEALKGMARNVSYLTYTIQDMTYVVREMKRIVMLHEQGKHVEAHHKFQRLQGTHKI